MLHLYARCQSPGSSKRWRFNISAEIVRLGLLPLRLVIAT